MPSAFTVYLSKKNTLIGKRAQTLRTCTIQMLESFADAAEMLFSIRPESQVERIICQLWFRMPLDFLGRPQLDTAHMALFSPVTRARPGFTDHDIDETDPLCSD